jgi:hypothetical protein
VRDERGGVTAELAIGLVAVVTVLGAVLAVGAAGLAQLRCADAARAGARAAALGEPDADVRSTAVRVAGAGAAVEVARADGWVTVVVRDTALGGLAGPGLQVRGEAVAREEP